MADYELKGYQESAKFHLAQVAGNFVIPSEPFKFYLGTRKVCDAFLTLAVASLLGDFKIEFFYSNLARSAVNWKNYLLCHHVMQKVHAPVRYTAPYYAAIITGDIGLMKALMSSLNRDYIPGHELESVFYKLRLMLLMASSDRVNIEVEKKHLVSFSNADGDDASVSMFSALIDDSDVSESEFWDTFETSLYDYEEQVASKMKSVSTRIERFISHRYLWLEGVCWLRIAIKRGFTLSSTSIHFCPDEALGGMPVPYAGDWQVIHADPSAHSVE